LFETVQLGIKEVTNPATGYPLDGLKPIRERIEFISRAGRASIFKARSACLFPAYQQLVILSKI
jgi:hypothetical protein